jgi:hypothetical protein
MRRGAENGTNRAAGGAVAGNDDLILLTDLELFDQARQPGLGIMHVHRHHSLAYGTRVHV